MQKISGMASQSPRQPNKAEVTLDNVETLKDSLSALRGNLKQLSARLGCAPPESISTTREDAKAEEVPAGIVHRIDHEVGTARIMTSDCLQLVNAIEDIV